MRGWANANRPSVKHAIAEAKRQPVQAVVFIGDSMEENVDKLGDLAGQLKILGLPVFIFQEGFDARASMASSKSPVSLVGLIADLTNILRLNWGNYSMRSLFMRPVERQALLRLSKSGSSQAALLLDQLS